MKAQLQQAISQSHPHQEKLQLEKDKLASELQQNQLHNAHKTLELGLAKANIETDRIRLMAGVQISHNQNLMQLEKVQTERLTTRLGKQ